MTFMSHSRAGLDFSPGPDQSEMSGFRKSRLDWTIDGFQCISRETRSVTLLALELRRLLLDNLLAGGGNQFCPEHFTLHTLPVNISQSNVVFMSRSLVSKMKLDTERSALIM